MQEGVENPQDYNEGKSPGGLLHTRATGQAVPIQDRFQSV